MLDGGDTNGPLNAGRFALLQHRFDSEGRQRSRQTGAADET